MSIKSKNKKVRMCLTVGTICIVVAGFWAILATPETALAKKPDKPPDGGNTSIRLARINFTNSPGVRSDGVVTCNGWDYWDERDADPGCTEGMGCRADVSGGGRLKFLTIWQGDDNSGSLRWLVLNFNDGGNSNQNPNIDELIYESGDPDDPPINETPGFDNVKTLISLDRMFKKGATRQPLSITIRERGSSGGWPPSGYSLSWRADLYIIETADPNVRILKTGSGIDEDLADLMYEDVRVGTYRMPLEWTMQLVP